MRNETKNIKITNPLEDYRIIQISRKTGKISGNINPALTVLQSEFMLVIRGSLVGIFRVENCGGWGSGRERGSSLLYRT